MSMKYRRLEGNTNEPVMGRGRQDFITDTEAVGQAVITRLRFFKGEWWENVYLGIPMWQEILGVVGMKIISIDRILQSHILDTKDVRSIQDLQSKFNSADRKYEFQCSINTVYGIVNITNEG